MTIQLRAQAQRSKNTAANRDQHVSVQVNQDSAHLPDAADSASADLQTGDTSGGASVSVNQGSSQAINDTSNSSSSISVSSSSSNACSIQTSGAVGTHNETTSNGSFNWNSTSKAPSSSSVSVHCQ